MIGQWNPDDSPSTHLPDPEQLAELAEQADEVLKNAGEMPLRNQAQGWIALNEHDWMSLFAGLSDEQLLSLAEFYIRAEMTLSGFESGADNPAISVFRYLKDQGRMPGKDVIRALKAQTSNRYIPYGKVVL